MAAETLTKKQQQVQQNKKKLLTALELCLGVVSAACKKVKLDRTTFYRYVENDTTFAAAVKEIEDVALDFAESALHKQIKAGIPASTIFYLKTKGRDRGYVERTEQVKLTDIRLVELKSKIEVRAKEKGITYEKELSNFLDNFGADIHTDIKQKLSSELEM